MRIVIVSDAWLPQVNGVVRTLARTVEELKLLGHDAQIISPDRFASFPCPTYAEIRLAVLPRRRLARLIDSYQRAPSISRPRDRWGWPPGAIASAGSFPSPPPSTPAFPST